MGAGNLDGEEGRVKHREVAAERAVVVEAPQEIAAGRGGAGRATEGPRASQVLSPSLPLPFGQPPYATRWATLLLSRLLRSY